MPCEKFENRLQLLLDERLSPAADPELQAHAARCGDCRELLFAEQQLFAGLRGDRRVIPPTDFSARVVAASALSSTVAREQMFSTRSLLLALVAVAGLILFLISPLWRTVDEPSKLIAPATPAIEEPADASRFVEVSLPVKASSPVGPIHDPQPALASTQSPGLTAEAWLENLRESFSEVSFESLEPMDQIADGLRPVANSLQTAVNALRRTLPGAKEPPPKQMPDTSRIKNSPTVIG